MQESPPPPRLPPNLRITHRSRHVRTAPRAASFDGPVALAISSFLAMGGFPFRLVPSFDTSFPRTQGCDQLLSNYIRTRHLSLHIPPAGSCEPAATLAETYHAPSCRDHRSGYDHLSIHRVPLWHHLLYIWRVVFAIAVSRSQPLCLYR